MSDRGMQYAPDPYDYDEDGNHIGWRIRYTDKRTGEKHYYMNVLFPSAESADRELKRIKRDKIKAIEYAYPNDTEKYRCCFKIMKAKNVNSINKKKS